MFNFNLMNRALNDSNLSDSAFRMLYIILNNCSLNNSNSAEIHNGYFMKVLNKKERMIKYLTNELVKKGYITKSINGTSKNKLANTYTLVEVLSTGVSFVTGFFILINIEIYINILFFKQS